MPIFFLFVHYVNNELTNGYLLPAIDDAFCLYERAEISRRVPPFRNFNLDNFCAEITKECASNRTHYHGPKVGDAQSAQGMSC